MLYGPKYHIIEYTISNSFELFVTTPNASYSDGINNVAVKIAIILIQSSCKANLTIAPNPIAKT